MKNPEKKKVGMVGSNEVVLYGEAHCLILGKQWLSIGKIKAVLANLEACRAFILKYDVTSAQPNADAEKDLLLKKIKELEEKAEKMTASQNGHSRLDPIPS